MASLPVSGDSNCLISIRQLMLSGRWAKGLPVLHPIRWPVLTSKGKPLDDQRAHQDQTLCLLSDNSANVSQLLSHMHEETKAVNDPLPDLGLWWENGLGHQDHAEILEQEL